MEKRIELLNNFVADLAVMNVKLHNLHWNVTGIHFIAIHKYTEDLYDDLFEKYDEVAEHVRMLGEYPLASMKQYLEHTGIKEIETHQIDDTKVITTLIDDLTYLREKITEIRNTADEANQFTTVALFEDYAGDFDKQLWILKAMAK